MQISKFKFVGTISKMGEDRIIWIPKKYHQDISELEGKQIRISIEDAI